MPLYSLIAPHGETDEPFSMSRLKAIALQLGNIFQNLTKATNPRYVIKQRKDRLPGLDPQRKKRKTATSNNV